MTRSETNQRRRQSSWTLVAIGLAYFMCVQLQQAGAILNCFTPKMFTNKLGKGGQQVPYPGGGGGGGPERANWYPQYYTQQASYNQQYPRSHYGMHAQYPSMK